MGMKYKAARAQMFREKVANLNEAVDMLRASEVAAQHIKEIEQGSTSDKVVSVCIVRYASTSSWTTSPKVHGPEACCYISNIPCLLRMTNFSRHTDRSVRLFPIAITREVPPPKV